MSSDSDDRTVEVPSTSAAPASLHGKKSRTKSGCLCCRKRKKKCDETHPECRACVRNSLTCVWPVGRDEMSAAPRKDVRSIRDKYRAQNAQLMEQLDIAPRARRQVVRSSDLVKLDSGTEIHAHMDDTGIFVVSTVTGPKTDQKVPVRGSEHSGRAVPPPGPGPRARDGVSDGASDGTECRKIVLRSPAERGSTVIKRETAAADASVSTYPTASNAGSGSGTPLVFVQETPAGAVPAGAAADARPAPRPHPAHTELASEVGLDPYVETSLNKFRTWIPNVSLSTDDAFLYHLFVTEFMPAISPLHCHPALSPGAICIPQVIYSPVLREIFLSCGAVYLGNKIPEFRDFARDKYHRSIRAFTECLKSEDVKGDEDWLLVAAQSFVLLERSSGMSPTSYARHLGAFYNIWSKRLQLRNYVIDSRVSPVERNLVEAFIFNYSVTILMCDHRQLSACLPSPFHIFNGKFFPDLKKPIYDECVVPWMNNPIVGSALDSFIFASKASWLCRLCLPFDKHNYERCLELEKQIDAWRPAELPQDLESLPNYILLRNNVSVSVLTTRAAKILVTKMLRPELTSASELIQEQVEAVIGELVAISTASTECCLPYWSILVAGSATVNEDQLDFFKQTNYRMAQILNSSVAVHANKYLTKVWDLNAIKQGEGFEAMFNRKFMDTLVQ